MRRRYFLSLLPAGVCAQEPKTPERARRVVDAALQAMGGGAYLGMQDRVEEGRSYSFYNEKLSGLSRAKIYTRYLTRPEPPKAGFIGIRERQAFGKKEDVYIVFNEEGGYEITYRGAMPLPKETIERYTSSLSHNILYTLRMRIGEVGMTFESLGTDTHENQPCERIEIIDSTNSATSVWFHQSTKLPVKQKWEHRDPKTRERIEETTIFDKYRDAGGGAMWPFVVRRERNGFRVFEMYADSIQINQGLTDALFTLGSEMKVRDPKSSSITPGKK